MIFSPRKITPRYCDNFAGGPAWCIRLACEDGCYVDRKPAPVSHDWPHEFRDGRAVFSCGWTLVGVPLDEGGTDRWGWTWGAGTRLWHCSDGVDSVTVRAPTMYDAIEALVEAGMPPRELHKLGWRTADYLRR